MKINNLRYKNLFNLNKLYNIHNHYNINNKIFKRFNLVYTKSYVIKYFGKFNKLNNAKEIYIKNETSNILKNKTIIEENFNKNKYKIAFYYILKIPIYLISYKIIFLNPLNSKYLLYNNLLVDYYILLSFIDNFHLLYNILSHKSNLINNNILKAKIIHSKIIIFSILIFNLIVCFYFLYNYCSYNKIKILNTQIKYDKNDLNIEKYLEIYFNNFYKYNLLIVVNICNFVILSKLHQINIISKYASFYRINLFTINICCIIFIQIVNKLKSIYNSI